MEDLVNDILPFADSLGMNEQVKMLLKVLTEFFFYFLLKKKVLILQELENLKSILLYGKISVVTDSNPRVASALDDMRQVFRWANSSIMEIRILRMILSEQYAIQILLQASTDK